MHVARPRPHPKVHTLETETAHERHQRIYKLKQAYEHGRKPARPKSKSDLEVVKERHRFIQREDVDPESLDWEDQLALKYYNTLFREYAVVNLKKYKTGAIALRWRTEDEVLSGIGHLTCASLRCEYHQPSISSDELDPDSTEPLVPTRLDEFEVPFAYMEEGQKKSALVKLVLCRECGKKLMYGKRKEKEEKRKRDREVEKELEESEMRRGKRGAKEDEDEDDYRPDLPPDLRNERGRASSSRRRSASPPRRSH